MRRECFLFHKVTCRGNNMKVKPFSKTQLRLSPSRKEMLMHSEAYPQH